MESEKNMALLPDIERKLPGQVEKIIEGDLKWVIEVVENKEVEDKKEVFLFLGRGGRLVQFALQGWWGEEKPPQVCFFIGQEVAGEYEDDTGIAAENIQSKGGIGDFLKWLEKLGFFEEKVEALKAALKDAFKNNGKSEEVDRVVIIDDTVFSGATFLTAVAAAIRALKGIEPKDIADSLEKSFRDIFGEQRMASFRAGGIEILILEAFSFENSWFGLLLIEELFPMTKNMEGESKNRFIELIKEVLKGKKEKPGDWSKEEIEDLAEKKGVNLGELGLSAESLMGLYGWFRNRLNEIGEQVKKQENK